MSLIDFQSLPKVVAIVGSREFPHRHWVYRAVDSLKPNTMVVSGGALGVDTWAEERTKERKERDKDIFFKPFNVEKEEWGLLGPTVGFARNRAMLTWVKWFEGHCLIFGLQSKFDAKVSGSYDDKKVCEKLDIPYTLILV